MAIGANWIFPNWVFQAKRIGKRKGHRRWLARFLILTQMARWHWLTLVSTQMARWLTLVRGPAPGVLRQQHPQPRAAGVEAIQQRTGSSRLGGVDCIRLNPVQKAHGAGGTAAEI